ncbi:MAG: septum formation initiator family protein [Deltaproteobacteria bacterium]|nr:septum formation initiator family protein [Deltaproteobacteria bacterium]MCK5514891.1 septum formation initiator family protein [Deltaproteobacteria bacterium]
MKFLNNVYGLFIILGFIFFILAYSCFGERGIKNVIALKKELSEIENYKQSLKIENKKLEEYNYFLKNDKKFIENIAREELGLVKTGEMVYFFEDN